MRGWKMSELKPSSSPAHRQRSVWWFDGVFSFTLYQPGTTQSLASTDFLLSSSVVQRKRDKISSATDVSLHCSLQPFLWFFVAKCLALFIQGFLTDFQILIYQALYSYKYLISRWEILFMQGFLQIQLSKNKLKLQVLRLSEIRLFIQVPQYF